MAESRLDVLESLPSWQLILAWLFGAAVVVAGWYFLYFADATGERTRSREALRRAQAELATAEDQRANYEQRVREQAARDEELKRLLEVVPVDSSTIDHLMSTFQREARGVGLELERWVPQPEEYVDFYAKIPVEVTAIGSWHQIGQFFHEVAEMKKIVNVEDVTMKSGKEFDTSGFPLLEVDFTASTFRLLSDEEQGEGGDDSRRGGRR